MSYYLIARLKVKYGHMAEAAAGIAKFAEILKPHGWKLLGSYHPIIGDFMEITDIWEVPDAETVPKALAVLGAGTDKVWESVFAEFRNHVEAEQLSLCAKFPFSP